jgi:hypothetical protein
MRVYFTERTMNAAELRAQLLSARLAKGGSDAALDALRAMNPHIADFDAIPAGTTLLVPQAPGFKISATSSTMGDLLDALRARLVESIDSATQDAKRGGEARGAEREAVAAAMRVAAVKRAIDADAELKEQVAQALAQMDADRKSEEQSLEALGETAKAALAEVDALRKLFG